MKKILVVAAHPDDEILGCGGTIAKHTNNGDDVHVLILAEGITSRGSVDGLPELRTVAEKANRFLGASVSFRDFPDNKMDSVPLLDVVKEVEKVIQDIQPEVVYTHYENDLNVDHQITYQAVMTACRPLPDSIVKTILSFEVPSSTEWGTGFCPNWFVEIDIHKKIHALRFYEMEMRKLPHPRSYEAVEYLAKWRGASVGVRGAEAFMLRRRLV